MRALPAYHLIDHSPESPIVLAGPPRRLIGRAQLYNRGDERAVTRQAELRDLPSGRLPAEQAETARQCAVSMVAILAPGQRTEALLRAAIDPHTPPGPHEATLVLGEHTHPVRLEIAEDFSISATPSVLVIENKPGGRATRRVTYRNDGNMPLTVGPLGALPLDEQLAVCRTLRSMLEENAETAETADQWLTAFLRQGKKQLDKSGLLWVDAQGGPVTIEPGAMATVELMIRMPDTLTPKGRYFAIGFVYDIDLQFVVVPTGAAEGPQRRRK
jgi:hypothetical protein